MCLSTCFILIMYNRRRINNNNNNKELVHFIQHSIKTMILLLLSLLPIILREYRNTLY
uniref:Uncharacterized protein n=1 Tax=Amphimedon queenslandica TaxID=400682 RepID=A0A1X7SN77_AMPQE